MRNDNLDNGFDTIEFTPTSGRTCTFTTLRTGQTCRGRRPFGNVTDSRLWIRGLPSGSLHPEEIAAIFTTIGEAPGSLNLPGEIPDRLSLMIAIKNFSADNSNNVNDPTLPLNPAQPPNTLLLIAGTSSIKELNYASTFKRGGYAGDSSSMLVEIDNVPRVIVIQGSFLSHPRASLGSILTTRTSTRSPSSLTTLF